MGIIEGNSGTELLWDFRLSCQCAQRTGSLMAGSRWKESLGASTWRWLSAEAGTAARGVLKDIA
jgi:hypothetical protein